jgi:hypothetical protein
MATLLEELSAQFENTTKQFVGFPSMMRETLDKMSTVYAWRTTVDEALDTFASPDKVGLKTTKVGPDGGSLESSVCTRRPGQLAN